MANDITSNPWNIDTSGFTYAYRTKIDNITWADAAASQTLTITDNNGKNIIVATTPTSWAGGVWSFGKIGWVNGVKITTVPSGTVINIAIGAGK